ncbi:hypothetical protein [Ciceribacter azotifigens]|uniref:hypothetical protein n=1 Tax=Ciceribacter azotifigens TaxID=2069303 RepID=UPI003A8922A4
MSKTKDRKSRKPIGNVVDARLRLLLMEIESRPVPPRIEALAKDLQAALEQRAEEK